MSKKIDISFLNDVKNKEVMISIMRSKDFFYHAYVNDIVLMNGEIILEIQLENGFTKLLPYDEVSQIQIAEETFLYTKNHIDK